MVCKKLIGSNLVSQNPNSMTGIWATEAFTFHGHTNHRALAPFHLSCVGTGSDITPTKEGVWFGDHRIFSLLYADNVVLSSSSSQDLQPELGRLADECKGMRVSTAKSKAVVRDPRKVVCSLWVGGLLS